MTSLARSAEGRPDAAHETRADALLDSRWVDHALLPRSAAMARWVGWRLRLLVVAALLGSLGIFALLRTLAGLPHIDAQWRSIGNSGVELTASADAQLASKIGRRLVAIEQPDGRRIEVDASMLQRSPRWTVDDQERQAQMLVQEQLGQSLQQPVLKLHFDDRSAVQVTPNRRGFTGLGALFWFLAGRTPGMAVLGLRVVTTHPRRLSWIAALLRALVLAYFPLGALWALADRRCQGVHDKVAHTSVVRVPAAR